MVNNAGMNGGPTTVAALALDELRRLVDINVIGVFLVAREAVRRMATDQGGAGGAIVNLGSVAAVRGSPGERVHYAASKGAVVSMTAGLAYEVARSGIRVNCVSPRPDRDRDERARPARPAGGPPCRSAAPPTRRRSRGVILFLLSEEASYIVGANLDRVRRTLTMARLPYRERADLAPQDQDLLARNINLFRMLVNSPNGARGVPRHRPFHPLRQQARPAAARDGDPAGRLAGAGAVRVVAPRQDRHGFRRHRGGHRRADRRQRRGRRARSTRRPAWWLRAAREAAAGPGIAAPTFAALKAALTPECLTDLVLVVSFYCCVVRVLDSLGIDVEPEYQPYLDAFPLPG